MRVVCENCGTTYKIPESKLVKEVNKATCRKCGFRMMIRRPSAAVATAADGVDPDDAATQVTANPLQQPEEGRGLLEAETRIEKGAVDDWSDDSPTNVQADPTKPAPVGSGPQQSSGPRGPAPAPTGKTESDMILALIATFASAGGAMLLATNTGDDAAQRMLGLGIALWGALTCLFLLVTGNLWRQKGNLPISIALATVLSAGGAAFVEIALHEGEGISGFTQNASEKPAESPPPATPESPEQAEPVEANNALDDGGEGSIPPEAALADEGSDDTREPSTDERDTKQEAASTKAATSAPQRSTARASSPSPSSARTKAEPEVRNAPDDEDELDLEDPIEDFDDFGDARSNAVAEAEPAESAEEKRRKEMEAAAAARAADRERKAKEAKEAKEAEKRRAQEKAKKSKSGGSKMTTLPLTVVDTMIRSNMSVKRCFFNEKQESGEMPRRVNVRFTVLNSGRVSSARVTTDQYKGGNLDSCLGRAFKVIQFPPFEGEAKSMTYPFVL